MGKIAFGISDLKIGPAVSLQIGIVYFQFMATGLPSEFELRRLGNGRNSSKYGSQNFRKSCRYDSFGGFVKIGNKRFAFTYKALTHVDVPCELVPEFEIKDLEVYCAPSGGSIGTITFEPGFSFSGSIDDL